MIFPLKDIYPESGITVLKVLHLFQCGSGDFLQIDSIFIFMLMSNQFTSICNPNISYFALLSVHFSGQVDDERIIQCLELAGVVSTHFIPFNLQFPSM